MCLSTLLILAATAIALAVFFYNEMVAFINILINLPTFVLVITIAVLAVIVVTINYGLAFSIAKKITESVSKIDFESPEDIDTYDELSSFVRTILRQQNEIESKVSELSELAETIRSIFGNMQEGFIMLDRFGAIITANSRAHILFDTNEEVEGKNINYISRNISFLDKVTAALQGHGGQLVMEVAKTDQIYQISFIPSADKGAIVLIADITERQLAEKMRREFSANVSHELNTPLTCIAGFAEIISKGQSTSEDVIYFAKKIHFESQRMIDMIENIVFLSKIDEMDGKDAFVRFDIYKVATEAIESMRAAAMAAQVQLVLVNNPLCVVKGNRHLIYVMFTNLISNAIRYNKPKGEVKVAVSGRGKAIYITVTDTGIGIPKEEQYRIFERFYRVEHSRNQKTGGAGLGLSIVKHVVRYHDGTIELESEPDQGTRVYIKFPQG